MGILSLSLFFFSTFECDDQGRGFPIPRVYSADICRERIAAIYSDGSARMQLYTWVLRLGRVGNALCSSGRMKSTDAGVPAASGM